jgi:glutamate synthase (NADPH/NADH) large chain
MGLSQEAMVRRLAKGAKVVVQKLDAQGVEDVRELVGKYLDSLRQSERNEKVERLERLLQDPAHHFRMIVPANQQVAQEVSTE